MTKKVTFRKVFGQIHLWLGLATGLVVFLVSITGCILVFEREIQDATQTYRFVNAEQKGFLPPSQLKTTAAKALPDKKMQRLYYGDAEHAAYGLFYEDEAEYYYAVYFNPYNGKVLEIKDMRSDFFTIITYMHYTLLLGDIGHDVVAWAVVIFAVLLITGMVLWFPKGKTGFRSAKVRKSLFTVNFKNSGKRVNYDLHNVLGFYSSFIIIVIAFTAVVWSFSTFRDFTYWVATGGETKPKKEKTISKVPVDTTTTFAQVSNNIDKVFYQTLQSRQDIQHLAVYFPEEKESLITIRVNPDSKKYYREDYYYYDQYTLKLLKDNLHQKRNNGEKLYHFNYDLHVGSWGGLPTQILAFASSLIAASLPITGFLVWYNRKFKKKKKVVFAVKTA